MGIWHRLIGITGVLVFLGTGLYLATGFPELHGGNGAVRYQFRANHAYILLSSLINAITGIHWQRPRSGWRGRAQTAGSLLLLGAPAVLLAAFFVEPPRGAPERPLTTTGMVILLGGTGLHALGRWPRPP